jgi:hypothetical protein
VPLAFDLNTIDTIEFGVGRDTENGIEFVVIPVDANVQQALREMASNSQRIIDSTEEPQVYQPSEKYESPEYVVTRTQGDFAGILRQLHTAQMMPIDAAALDDPGNVSCYFARFSNQQMQHLTAVRRATQFKGILKNRLLQFGTDALKVVEQKTFKLDNDFDVLVEDEQIHILRATGFEVIAELQEIIQAAVPRNAARVQQQMPFVDFVSIQNYASEHPRAAKILASICSEDEARNVSRERLFASCNECGVMIEMDRDIMRVSPGSELKFLEVLDRRRYRFQLIEGEVENYRAASRKKV